MSNERERQELKLKVSVEVSKACQRPTPETVDAIMENFTEFADREIVEYVSIRELEIYGQLLKYYRFEVERHFSMMGGLRIAENPILRENMSILTDITTQKVAALGKALSVVGLGKEANLIIEEIESKHRGE